MATQTTSELVTPKKAEDWLNVNTNNRHLSAGVAEKYAADMTAGRWTECVAPIVFYDDGDLADGQHRLFAIVESGTTQRFLVTRNLSREAGLNIDTGRVRTVVDNARISGTDRELSSQLISYARGIDSGTSVQSLNRVLSNAEVLEVVERHREPAEWLLKRGPVGRGIRNAVICAAFGRAWYVEADKERLAKCAEILSKGYYDGESESAAIALRNYLILKREQKVSIIASAVWRDTFLKAQKAIHSFMRGKALQKIRTVETECYPLASSGKTTKRAPSKAPEKATNGRVSAHA